MSYIKIPCYPVRRGEEAIDALKKYVEEINGEESTGLTERQKAALTRIARALISSLEAEVGDGDIESALFPISFGDIREAILKPFHKPSHQNIEKQPISSHPHPHLHSELPMPEQIR